jgi:Tol biopolymer transport system component
MRRNCTKNRICSVSAQNDCELIDKNIIQRIAVIIVLIVMIIIGGSTTMQAKETDTISNLSFSHDGKKVIFDRCRSEGCQIQVYNLETGELAAYQSPHNERWTMGKYAYDGKRIAFSVIPIKPNDDLDLGEMQIAVMDADGKNFRKVTTGLGAKLYPTFSHNGKKILYTCAANIRKEGRTAASQYDAWEVNLETGGQTQLTFFKYFYMSNLTYFPDDERFIFYGDRPSEFEGMKAYPNEDAFIVKMRELNRQGKSIGGVVVMKGNQLVIPNPYQSFPEQNFPQKPLLSKDGNMLIYEKYQSGKFYLYSDDGNHRYVGGGGSIRSAAISPGGELLVINYDTTINIYTIQNGKLKQILYVSYAKKATVNWEEAYKGSENLYVMIPETPLRILNR